MPCPQWPQGLGKHWLALGLLLVCVTTPGSALAFPNDVLSRLSELYHKDADRHHHAENSSSSLLSFPSMSSEERGPLLIKTVSSSPSSGDASYTSTDSHKGAFRMDKPEKEGGYGTHDPENTGQSVYSESRHTDGYNIFDNDGAAPVLPGTLSEDLPTVKHNTSSSLTGHNSSESDAVTDSEWGDSPRQNNNSDTWQTSVSTPQESYPGVDGHHKVHSGADTPHSRAGEGGLWGKDRGEKTRCAHCQIREDDRRNRVESIKRQILKKIHLTAPPNMTGVAVPKALAHMSGIQLDGLMQDAPYGGYQHYDGYEDDSDDEYSAPERVFTVAKPMPGHLRTSNTDSCYFNIPAEVINQPIQKAYLWFYVRLPTLVQSTVVEMRVSRLGPHYKRLHPARKVLWSQKAYPEKAFGWKRVDLSALVRRWAKHPSSNYGLQIVAANGDENLAILPGQASESERGYEPILDIKVLDNHRRRFKRSEFLTCTANSTEHRCCRYPLRVSFAEFGWDWVIAPTHVKADYCSGECRMTLQDQTAHSWISSQMPRSRGSCCTPAKMSALPLLYFDQSQNVVFQMLQNMKIERCGCF